MFITLTIDRIWKLHKCLSVGEWMMKNGVYIYKGLSLSTLFSPKLGVQTPNSNNSCECSLILDAQVNKLLFVFPLLICLWLVEFIGPQLEDSPR